MELPDGMKRVLSISGGGMLGLLPATRLAHSPKFRGPLFSDGKDWQDADLYVGTSTGGLIALGLATGKTPEQIAEFYTVYGPKIFRKPFWGMLRLLVRDRYRAKPLERAILEVLGDVELWALHRHVLITASDYTAPIRQHGLHLFRKGDDVTLFDAARATSAAPSYFREHRIGKRILWDGGIIANNPAMCAYTEAEKLWPGEPIDLVSFGTGIEPGRDYAPSRIPVGALDDVVQLGIQGNMGAVHAHLCAIARRDPLLSYRHFDFQLDRPIAMDDARRETIDYLRKAACRATVQPDPIESKDAA